MKKTFAIFSVVAFFAFCSCNHVTLSGNDITRSFNIENTYTKLSVANAFEVTVSDTAQQVYVTTDENVMPKVVVEKIGNKLSIYLKPMTTNFGMDLKVILPYNELMKDIELSGASEFRSDFGLSGEALEIKMSGASELDCNIETTNLELDMSGASEATLTGQAANLDLELSGASRVKKTVNGAQYAFACDYCEGEMSGASRAYIHCNSTIDIDLSGASDLHYTGMPFTGDCTISGGSQLIHDEL